MRLAALIFATEGGTRFRSRVSVVLHPLAGMPMAWYALHTVSEADAEAVVLIVGEHGDQVRRTLGESAARYVCLDQGEDTGHALLRAHSLLGEHPDLVLACRADMPLLTSRSVIRLLEAHSLSRPAVTVLTLADDDPMGRERANHGVDGALVEIAEGREDAPEGQDTRVHCGACCLDGNWLWSHIDPLSRSSVGREDILADVIRMALSEGQRVQTILADDPDEMLRIEDRTHLARAEAIIRRRVNEQLMLKGVTLQDPASTYIDATVTIGSDTVILANTHLAGQTSIGQECVIGPNSIIRDSHIGDRCRVTASVVEEAVMEEDCNIGPFGHIRPKARMCAGSHMGNFGEIKNATLGPGVKMGHFGYLGDATIGEGANIGAGTITCNYDGERKHPTTIGKNAFLGAGSILIAPMIIGDESRTGAGAVVTRDVPPNTLVYGVPARPAPPKDEGKDP